jgi:hypothetical protein
LGNGDGTFQPAVTNKTGSILDSIAVGDFNGDGKPDLAVAGVDCVVLFGNGDGTFQPGVSLGLSGFAVAAADFNGDGKLDLAVCTFSGKIAVLPGDGDGAFQSPIYANGGVNRTLPGSNPIAVGDFNGDGKLDLAAVSGNSTISVFLGRGDGTFQPPINYNYNSYNSPPSPQSLAAGDFNGDGKLDLAVVNNAGVGDIFGPAITNSVSALLGNGDGTFRPPLNYPVVWYPTTTAVGDFNSDGKLDLAVADSGSFSILLGNGDGTFQSVTNFSAAGVFAQSVIVGDLNRDGKPDLIVDGDGISVLLNTSPCAGLHLDVAQNKKNLTLSWPLPYTNFVLECTTNLNSTNWQPVVGTLATSNGHCETIVPLNQAPCYFRLRKR